MQADFYAKVEKAKPSMSKSQARIVAYILQNFDKAASMTAGKLASQVGVSESTVVRFADFLGYSGYPALQQELQDTLRSRLTGVERMALTDETDNWSLLTRVLKNDIDNIRDTLASLDGSAFEATVTAVLQAKRIYILGVRSVEPVAHALGYYLDFIRDNVRVLNAASQDPLEQLIHIGEGDLFIGISFPRYSKRTVDAMRFAREHGARCIGLTDSNRSPISELADICMAVQCNTVSFNDSLVAPLSVVNAILAAVSQKKKQELSEHLKEMESIWHNNQFYATRK